MTDDTGELKRSYWVVIPADLFFSEKLESGAKLLYGDISNLCNDKGYCWASNAYFADRHKVSSRTVQRWIKTLEKEEFVYIPSENKMSRKIFLSKKMNIDDGEVREPEVSHETKKKKSSKAKSAPAKKLKKEKMVKYSERDLYLAELLLSKIIYNYPQFENKKVNISEWAEEIRKLREIDNANEVQIEFMINWLHGGEVRIVGKPAKIYQPHEFWSKNIMSAAKLRKQWFENLIPQLKDEFKKDHKKTAVAQL